MTGHTPPPVRVDVEVGEETRPAQPVALFGQWVAVRGDRPLRRLDPARIHLHWADGGVTTLLGRVRTQNPMGPSLHLTHIDLQSVDGDWDSFVRYLGTHLAHTAVA